MTIKCHFDGKVLVPEEPIELPMNQSLFVTVENGAVIVDPPDRKPITAEELANSELVGIWADRSDIIDSTEFSRQNSPGSYAAAPSAVERQVTVLDSDVISGLSTIRPYSR